MAPEELCSSYAMICYPSTPCSCKKLFTQLTLSNQFTADQLNSWKNYLVSEANVYCQKNLNINNNS